MAHAASVDHVFLVERVVAVERRVVDEEPVHGAVNTALQLQISNIRTSLLHRSFRTHELGLFDVVDLSYNTGSRSLRSINQLIQSTPYVNDLQTSKQI